MYNGQKRTLVLDESLRIFQLFSVVSSIFVRNEMSLAAYMFKKRGYGFLSSGRVKITRLETLNRQFQSMDNFG